MKGPAAQNKTMNEFEKAVEEAIENNPNRSGGSETVEGDINPTGLGEHQKEIIKSYDEGVDWNDDTLWFDCPSCGNRLCSGWFLQAGSKCRDCGASVTMQFVIEWAE